MDTFHIHNGDQLIIRPTAFSVSTDDRPDSPRQGQVDMHMPLTAKDADQLMALLADRFPDVYAKHPRRDTLMFQTREGIEVHGTLEAFSLHYPPAKDSEYVEGDDCINALFIPDDPTWETLWAELDSAVDPQMFVDYPMPATCDFPGCDSPRGITKMCDPCARSTL